MTRGQPEEVLEFWFDNLQPAQWWRKSSTLDRQIESRFGELLAQARAGELSHWRDNARGCLAEILILDQFSRHIHRGMPDAFAADPQALVLAQWVIAQGWDSDLSAAQRQFLYMPFMHSESRQIQSRSMQLFQQLGEPAALDSARRHHDIIARFGRYPHRNEILGRTSSTDELQFLKQPGSGF